MSAGTSTPLTLSGRRKIRSRYDEYIHALNENNVLAQQNALSALADEANESPAHLVDIYTRFVKDARQKEFDLFLRHKLVYQERLTFS